MAGYILYSLDWNKFREFVKNPTRQQLLALAKQISDGLDGPDDAFEEGDPVHDWPSEPEELCDRVKQRLARPDWYGDLSDAGKDIWSSAICNFCSRTGPNGVGFRVDHDGIYWDVIALARKHLHVPPNQFSPEVELSAFGERAYRHHPPTEGPGDVFDWRPMHSLHTPDEVRKMLQELESVGPVFENVKDQQAVRDYDSLVPVLEKLVDESRMLFVQVDT